VVIIVVNPTYNDVVVIVVNPTYNDVVIIVVNPTYNDVVVTVVIVCYRRSQFYWWRKPEYPEKTTHLQQGTDTD
jgi:hypothetical protein